jgi:hypothetical protein
LIRTANILSEQHKRINREKELIDNLENKLDEKLNQKTLQTQEYLKKEILDEIRNILKEGSFKEENLKKEEK